ncbi:hypothetical protein SUGI_0114310 [Cryptomeria japonica]|nr:hypothetical protein SUGI_0114310 [Cryptomeria japonica]
MVEISAIRNFSMSGRRFMQRLRYRKLDNFNTESRDERFDEFDVKRKKQRTVSLGGYKSKLVWKLKLMPKLKLRVITSAVKVSPKSWLAKIGKGYVNTMFNLFRPIPRKTRVKLKAEDFNDKVIVDFYKSLGIQLQALPDNVPLTSHSELNLKIVRI